MFILRTEYHTYEYTHVLALFAVSVLCLAPLREIRHTLTRVRTDTHQRPTPSRRSYTGRLKTRFGGGQHILEQSSKVTVLPDNLEVEMC